MRDLTPVTRKVDDDWLCLDYSFGQVQAKRYPSCLFGYLIKIYIDSADRTIMLENHLCTPIMICLLLSGIEEGAQYAMECYKYNVARCKDDSDCICLK